MIDSWIDLADRRPLPFMQIYAKADEVVDWDTATAQPALSERATGTLVIDADKRHSYTIVDIGARLIGLSAQADRSSPLVFADTRVSTGIQDPARPKRWRYTGPR
jgi:hypothetical protein